MLYRGSGEAQRARLSVTIDSTRDDSTTNTKPANLDPADSWTIRKRIYDLRPLPGRGSILLGSDDQVDLGHRFFVRLGNDLKAGTYKIKIRRIDDIHDGCVLMYQTVPGARIIRDVRIHANSRGRNEQ